MNDGNRAQGMTGQRNSAKEVLIFAETLSDPRADRGRRHVAVGTDQVTIRRRVQGIDMRLSLAVSAYRGVALCLAPRAGGELIYQVRLVHQDNDLSIVLDEAQTDHDIIADWRLWARVLGLPALVERSLGTYEPAEGDRAQSQAASAPPRRKRLLKRRPRVLANRKPGDLGRMTAIHADEREIIARD